MHLWRALREMNKKLAVLVFLAALALFSVATMKPRLEFGETFEGFFGLVGIVFAMLAVVLVAVGTSRLRHR